MEIIYFSFNNWFGGRDYPLEDKYRKLINERYLNHDDWVIENKLVVVTGMLDMSVNWCVAAPKQWVEKHLPELLTNDFYTYTLIQYYKGEEIERTYTKKYSDFVYTPNEDEPFTCRYGMPFMEYSEENIGVHWWDEYKEKFIDE